MRGEECRAKEEGEGFGGSLEVGKNFCSQCGQRYTDRACGPTHAILCAEVLRSGRWPRYNVATVREYIMRTDTNRLMREDTVRGTYITVHGEGAGGFTAIVNEPNYHVYPTRKGSTCSHTATSAHPNKS